MIKIVPDKEGKLTQWDLNRKVIVTGYDGGAEVHFASPGDDHGAYVVDLVDGEAEIPNILLTMAGTINVYVYPADRTVFATALWVMAREKPDDYVYTETEVLDWRALDEKIGDLTELTTTARENLVAAINEAATKGMASIYMRVAEGYIEYSGDGVNWKQLIAVAELKGDTVDIVTPTAESTDTQAASAKAVWNMLGTGGSGGGGSGTDISLGITGASVGDIIKVKAVDDSGKPTAWEAAELGMRLIRAITLAEQTDRVDITTDENGNTFSLNEVYCSVNAQSYTDKNEQYYFLPNGGWTTGDPYITSSNTSSRSSDSWKNQMNFYCVYASGYIMAEQLPAGGSNNNLQSRVVGNMSPITKISVAGKMAVGCTIVVWGR